MYQPVSITVLGCTIAGLTSLTALHLAAQEPTATPPPGFTLFQPAPTGQPHPTRPTAVQLSQPKKPSTTRGLICEPSQPKTECDDRQPMIDQRQPWSAIGRITFTDGNTSGHCTGTLIADNLVLTNAHCIVNPDTAKPHSNLQFEPNLINGYLQDPKDKAQIIGGTVGTDFKGETEPPHPQDWAIAKLAKPLGKKYGTIAIKPLPIEVLQQNPKKLIQIGYSFDFPDPRKPAFRGLSAGPGKTAGMHDDCSITQQRSDTVFIHNCDTRGGSSGGPILGWIDDKLYIIALNAAEYADQKTGIGTANYATDLTPVQTLLTQTSKTRELPR